MSITPRQSFFGLVGLLLLTIVAIGLTMYWANTQLDIRSETIIKKRIESRDLEIKTIQAGQLKEQLQQNVDLVNVTSSVLPEAKTQENIVGELIAIAAGRGLKLENISFSGAADSSKPETSQTEAVDGLAGVFSLTVQTSIETDYENALRFLTDLEDNKRQFEVVDLSIAPSTDSSLFSVSLSIITYIRP